MTITRNFSVLANGAGSANNLSLGGATLGSNALAVTGTTYISSTLNFGGLAAEGTVVAAATTDLGISTANRQSVTGNTTITGFGTAANSYRIIRFTGTPLLTYNATSLITPTGANIQAAPGDIATLTSDVSGNWTIINYLPSGGIKTASRQAYDCGSAWTSGGNVSLTPGKWSIAAQQSYGGYGGSYCGVVVNTTANSAAGNSCGVNLVFGAVTAGSGGCTVNTVVTLTTTTTYYANCFNDGASGYGGTNSQIIATRVI